MKKLILPLITVCTYACTPGSPPETFINNTRVFLCNQTLQLNHPVPDHFLSNSSVQYDQESDTYTLSCDQRGIVTLGAEKEGAQILFVQELEFEVDKDSRVIHITGYWYELNQYGRRRLEEAKRFSHQSAELRQQVEELEASTVKLNDFAGIQRELYSVLGEPETLRPISWNVDNGWFSFNSARTEWETIYWVHVSAVPQKE
ncbi:hypothetical protein QLX67_06880 [Balneolaceae bacterium ANBcel3]|nr:hypothetical protein [Balneolaceae bacterium ANBcel3]